MVADKAVNELNELVMANEAIIELVELVVANEAINELNELVMANEAINELVELMVAGTDKVVKAILINKAIVAGKAEADEANNAILTNKADEAIEIDKVIEANEASLAEANKLLATDSIAVIKYSSKLLLDDFIVVFAHICQWWRTNNNFTNSLTKYVAVFAKDKGYLE